MSFTAAEKQREAKREAMFRRSVYKELIVNGRMTREEANRRIAIMEEIAEDYLVQDQPRFPDSY